MIKTFLEEPDTEKDNPMYRSAASMKLYDTKRINGNISTVITGGHSEGHMLTLFNVNSRKYMYGGDLFPSAFHHGIPDIPLFVLCGEIDRRWKTETM